MSFSTLTDVEHRLVALAICFVGFACCMLMKLIEVRYLYARPDQSSIRSERLSSRRAAAIFLGIFSLAIYSGVGAALGLQLASLLTMRSIMDRTTFMVLTLLCIVPPLLVFYTWLDLRDHIAKK